MFGAFQAGHKPTTPYEADCNATLNTTFAVGAYDPPILQHKGQGINIETMANDIVELEGLECRTTTTPSGTKLVSCTALKPGSQIDDPIMVLIHGYPQSEVPALTLGSIC
jgi:hypothetical protein